MTTETASVHRLAPAVAARLLGVVLCAVAVLILLSTVAIAVLDLHTVFLLVPVAVTVLVLVLVWWTWRTKGWVARLTAEGYRVQWVRGRRDRVGSVEGRRGRGHHDHRRRTRRGAAPQGRADDHDPRRDARRSTARTFVRDVQQHLQRGHGLAKF